MPTYEYKCDNCGHEFDVFQSMKDDKLTTCPNCGKETLRRLIGAGSGLIFKGSGFYLTDYKNKTSDTGKPSAPAANADTSKTEAKPAAATASASTGSDTKPADTAPAKKEKKSPAAKKTKE